MICPNCGSDQVEIQTVQENIGSATITKTKSKYKEKGHGIVWWLLIGWWRWMIDLMIWVFAFVPRLFIAVLGRIFKKKKYVGSSTTASNTVNHITYKTICTCKNCAKTWTVQ